MLAIDYCKGNKTLAMLTVLA